MDKEAGAVGIAHAGRKGTFLGIASKTVEAMQSAFGARPGSMLAALGPAIGPCCYQVGQDVAGPFKESFRWGEDVFQSSGGGKSYFDIFKANRIQLNQAGVDDDRIIAPGLCTSCLSSMFYSYRRDGGIKGNIFSFVMLEA